MIQNRNRPHHSRRGEPPTMLERELLAAAAAERNVRSIWVVIGGRIGANALAVVMDELGGAQCKAPKREAFFARLGRARIWARICELRAQRLPVDQIAAATGVSVRTVSRALRAGRLAASQASPRPPAM